MGVQNFSFHWSDLFLEKSDVDPFALPFTGGLQNYLKPKKTQANYSYEIIMHHTSPPRHPPSAEQVVLRL
jgi:hypothetical protein